jgi:hypothetical protein
VADVALSIARARVRAAQLQCTTSKLIVSAEFRLNMYILPLCMLLTPL